jgi:hypothetical protein
MPAQPLRDKSAERVDRRLRALLRRSDDGVLAEHHGTGLVVVELTCGFLTLLAAVAVWSTEPPRAGLPPRTGETGTGADKQ